MRMFSMDNTDGYAQDQIVAANCALTAWDIAHPDGDEQDRKIAQESILYDIDA